MQGVLLPVINICTLVNVNDFQVVDGLDIIGLRSYTGRSSSETETFRICAPTIETTGAAASEGF